jgi:hypothetical protein
MKVFWFGLAVLCGGCALWFGIRLRQEWKRQQAAQDVSPEWLVENTYDQDGDPWT